MAAISAAWPVLAARLGVISAQPDSTWAFSQGEFACLGCVTDQLDYCFQLLDRCEPGIHQIPRRLYRSPPVVECAATLQDSDTSTLEVADSSLQAEDEPSAPVATVAVKRQLEAGRQPASPPAMAGQGMEEAPDEEHGGRNAARRRTDEYGPLMECIIREELGTRVNKLENDLRDHEDRISALERGSRQSASASS